MLVLDGLERASLGELSVDVGRQGADLRSELFEQSRRGEERLRASVSLHEARWNVPPRVEQKPER